jgi:hypothetical protein
LDAIGGVRNAFGVALNAIGVTWNAFGVARSAFGFVWNAIVVARNAIGAGKQAMKVNQIGSHVTCTDDVLPTIPPKVKTILSGQQTVTPLVRAARVV